VSKTILKSKGLKVNKPRLGKIICAETNFMKSKIENQNCELKKIRIAQYWILSLLRISIQIFELSV